MTKLGLLFVLLLGIYAPGAHASVKLLEKDDWKVSMDGFFELGMFEDTTRSYLEQQGAAPVSRNETVAGQTGRMQFSIRDTRLGFSIVAPKSNNWSTEGRLEFDLLGFNPQPGTAGNTEAGFFTSPTFRARRAYGAGSIDGWHFLAGQNWMIFGWQPYYIPATAGVAPLSGSVYGLNAQLAVLRDVGLFGGGLPAQLALSVTRPPQRDSKFPGLDLGARIEVEGRRAGASTEGRGDRELQPMSFGLSGTLREFSLPRLGGQSGEISLFPGGAVAVDGFVPVIAADDGATSVAGTLALLAEFTAGRGYGDAIPGWTGNLSTDPGGGSLDTGIGGVDSQGNFRLIDLRTWNVSAQYQLSDSWHSWLGAGYGNVYSDNANLFVAGNNLKVYSRQESWFANFFHEITPSLRVGVEYVYSLTSYADGEIDHNNRFQLSGWFRF